jgi:hypothetical protein
MQSTSSLARLVRRVRIWRTYRTLYRLMERQRQNAIDWMRWTGPQ